MPELDDVFAVARQLTHHDRWLLAHMLWDSLPPTHEWDAGEPIKLSSEDLAEFDRRVSDIESGRVEAIPGNVVREFLRQKVDGLRK
jgi:putative addiction module component (TIGR02574 family)